jgi:hypothetical protein
VKPFNHLYAHLFFAHQRIKLHIVLPKARHTITKKVNLGNATINES